MISAQLIKNLEQEGFELAFPKLNNDQMIISILKSENKRLELALPQLLLKPFDKVAIGKQLTQQEKRRFEKILAVSNEIYSRENIPQPFQSTQTVDMKMLPYFYEEFKEAARRKKKAAEKKNSQQLKRRNTLLFNASLAEIFSPGKRRILEKIEHHQPLTNTELKYYYRSIRPLARAILDQRLVDYMRVIEATKKIRQ